LGTVPEDEKKALRLSASLETDVITTHSAQAAYEQVLLYSGASLKRDGLDSRVVEEARTNTAQYKGLSENNSGAYPRPGIIDTQQDLKPAEAGDEWTAWPALLQEAVLTDSDKDGIPDGWLEANYPANKATDVNEDGYTYLEVYLNSLVEEITRKQNEKAITGIETDITAEKTNRLNIFYNKKTGEINIQANKNMVFSAIYNITGVLISNTDCGNKKEIACNINNLQSNFYIIRVSLEDKSVLAGKIFIN